MRGLAGVTGLLALLLAPSTLGAAPPEPPDAAAQVRRGITALVKGTDREERARAVLCLRRHGRALASALLEMARGTAPDTAARVAPHFADLRLDTRSALEVLEALANRKDVPEAVVLGPLAAIGPAGSPPLTALVRRALEADVSPPAPETPRALEQEAAVHRYVAALQSGALHALLRWHAHVPGIAPRLSALALGGHRPAAVRLSAARVLARLRLVEEEVLALQRSAPEAAPLLARLVVATAIGERLPETAAARYRTFREAFAAAPAQRGEEAGPLQGLSRADLAEALEDGGGILWVHLLAEIEAGKAVGEVDVAWQGACARSLPLGPAVGAEQVGRLLPEAAPDEPSQAHLDAERVLLVLLARLGPRAGEYVPVLSTRWQLWRLHPLGAGPGARTEIALAAIRGAWREPLDTCVAMLEQRGTQSALPFTVAASQVPDLTLDEALAPAFVKGLARGGEQRDHLLFFLAAGRRGLTPEAWATLGPPLADLALAATEPGVRRQALQALLNLGASLPAEACAR